MPVNTRSTSRARSSVVSEAIVSTDGGSISARPEPDDHLAGVNVHLRLSGGKRVLFGRSSLPVGKRRRIYAPPPPKPWWQEPPRAAALYKRTDACATCNGVQLEATCERCEKQLCGMCTRLCDVCGMTWCTHCSLVDYDSPSERTLCLPCWEDTNERKEDSGGARDDEIRLDEDEDMMSLE
ncbi:Cd27 binding protein (Siva) [Gracilaria domingensis]|nr:Cd27 binding protein (Siva) [Gracilaria domingensis]